MKPAIAALLLLLCASITISAQTGASFLLSNTNGLRARNGLPAYSLDSALNAAANNHAQWMATNNLISHQQSDGSNVRARAAGAGFSSSWVSENIYLGSSGSPNAAWNWWLNSPVHYAGLVSPNYDRVGIGSATVGGRTAFVMVFGNSSGQLRQADSASNGNAASNAASRQPAYVLGLDEAGNIKHEVQPGHTIGDIAVIYGYTWDDIPAMLALNDMTAAEIRYLQPGSVFLVPPQAGTFTPTSPAPSETATATPTPTSAAQTPPPSLGAQPTAAVDLTATRAIHILPIATAVPVPQHPASADRPPMTSAMLRLALLGGAILVQLGIIAGAGIAIWRGFH